MSEFNNEALNPGEHFIYNSIEFICLDIIDGNYLAMMAKPWQAIQFDTKNCNNWKKSSLRRALEDFLDLLEKKHLVIQTPELVADNGDKAYGTSEDYVTILSCDQYRKYRDIVPLFDSFTWTLTPQSCCSHEVCSIYMADCIYGVSAHAYGWVTPVCLFSSERLKSRRQLYLIGGDKKC